MEREIKKLIIYGIYLLLTLYITAQLLANIAKAEQSSSCITIIQKQTPPIPTSPLQNTTATAYITLQKDLQGQSQLTAPINAGIKINIPLLDKKEQLQLIKERQKALQQAHKTLEKYLTLKAKTEEEKQYISWKNQRVKEGIDYQKDYWKEYIKYKQDLAQLKALEIYYQSIGINKATLEKCYKEQMKQITPKSPKYKKPQPNQNPQNSYKKTTPPQDQ